MSLFEKVVESVEAGVDDEFTLASSVARDIREWTITETWYCDKNGTLNAYKDGSKCVSVGEGGKKGRHSAKKNGCGDVAIIRI